MLHEDNPTLVSIKALRVNNELPRNLTIRHSATSGFTIVDNEGVTYGDFKSYNEANEVMVSLKG